MGEERLSVYDEEYNRIGEASRRDVHARGDWHETFHCWFVHCDKISGEYTIYFQLRSHEKKDYPGLLDITAAGHIQSHESMEDGVREVKEELGLGIGFNELIFAGVIKEELTSAGILDRELANVFIYTKPVSLECFQLQTDEVSGIFRTKLRHFEQLISGEKKEIRADGFSVEGTTEKTYRHRSITMDDFVAHPPSYFKKLMECITNVMS
ncbi:NUDIX domain-containing protein [Rossellomorea aquimaris]|uniref:NUDIX hydrolase n=1 Tax=Rossellomorea aquimaris TaxID=189382 RepID=UPI001CD8090A|nr:NUDIX domain-containing protein [Rossellomorea aquimaris]MCA1053664.1 NUDIX domain-containing protein [Rossellomorea aquimaris]